MAAFDPIHPFGKDFDLKEAYNWNKDRILKFLEDVVKDPAKYNAPHKDEDKKDFKLLSDAIHALASPEGQKYKKPLPEQQILRKDSKAVKELEPTEKLPPWSGSKTKEEYFIIFDLLGAFLSFMGPVQTTSPAPTAKNFFLPLVIAYGRWCRELVPKNRQGSPTRNLIPSIVQITWSGDGKQWHFFLGAACRGYTLDKVQDPISEWMKLVQRRRYRYLDDDSDHKILRRPWDDFNKSPLRAADKNGPAGTHFGNCGETYPFIYILTDKELKKNCCGIAVNMPGIKASSYKGEDFWNKECLWPPCDNCQELMKLCGVENRLDDFKPWE